MKAKKALPPASFADLTWDQLKEWAGTKIVARGKSYLTNVEKPAVTEDGGLLAWVLGTERYATHVWFMDNELLSLCTCPYEWGPCKHAVGLILVGIDALKEQRSLPLVGEDDDRLRAISDCIENEHDLCDEEGEADYEESDMAMPGGRGPKPGHPPKLLQDILQGMTKDDLAQLVLDLARQHPEIVLTIQEREHLISGRVAGIVKSLREDIRELSSEPAWRSRWHGNGEVPNYTPVRRRLEALLSAGYCNQVVELGRDLWQRGNRQVERSDDDGETATQIGACMEVVLRAVKGSSMPAGEQLLWIIDAYLTDEFGMLIPAVRSPLLNGFRPEDWDQVADALLKRLGKMPASAGELEFKPRYQRNQVNEWLRRALKESGREEEIIPLLEREAPMTLCYDTLVEHLLAAGRDQEAHDWAVRGFKATCGSYSGIAWEMEEHLRMMAQKAGDQATVAAYRALEFFDHPSLGSYLELQKAAKACQVWDAVRTVVLHFLEKGERQDLPASPPRKGVKVEPPVDWPLPELAISWRPERRQMNHEPRYRVLIDIAIHEKRHDDAIALYEASRESDRWFDGSDEAVAEAVQETHPDVSLKIWKKIAEDHIARVKLEAYRTASEYLQNMGRVYQRLGQADQWREYLADLRKKHKAKRRLMEVLDELEGLKTRAGRIIDQGSSKPLSKTRH
ncbi:MAG: hypothetical protein KKE29_21400 [Proteobacteria bacterium]|nr:hypothetical protein [Pseudomonadota bacterium]MBU4599129.1 hypothetical protein [Pseudomonadota bacterium]